MKSMDNIIEVLDYLKEKGFGTAFYLKEKGVLHANTNRIYPFKDFTIAETIRVESDSDSDYTSMVYAIELKNGEKGAFIDASGAYAEFDIPMAKSNKVHIAKM